MEIVIVVFKCVLKETEIPGVLRKLDDQSQDLDVNF